MQLPLNRKHYPVFTPIAVIGLTKLRWIFLLLPLYLLSTCTSPREAFDQRDYGRAYKLALADLNKGKGDKETRDILRQSLEKILDDQTRVSRNLAALDEPEKWKEALDINYRLQDNIKQARAFLPNAFEKALYTLPQQNKWLRQKLYSYYYEEGLNNLVRNDSTGLKAYAQHAHGAFTQARQYVERPISELDSLTQAAYKKGIVYYQVEVDAPFSSYSWEIDRVFDDLEDAGSDFLRVSFEDPFVNADCDIEIRFDDLDISINEYSEYEDFNKEVIIEYNTVTDTAGNETEVPVYGTVEGTAVTVTKTKTATWEIDVRIRSRTPNCSLSGRSFEASIDSVIREVSTSGDERAIPEEYLYPTIENFMEEDDMAEALLEELYEQVVRAYF